MEYPLDAHRRVAVASRGEQAAGTHKATDSHGPAVAACSHRSRDLPAPQHSRLPLQPLGDGSDPEVVLRDCGDDHVHMRRVLCELREAVLEQVGKDQTDRLRRALSDALKALSTEVSCPEMAATRSDPLHVTNVL